MCVFYTFNHFPLNAFPFFNLLLYFISLFMSSRGSIHTLSLWRVNEGKWVYYCYVLGREKNIQQCYCEYQEAVEKRGWEWVGVKWNLCWLVSHMAGCSKMWNMFCGPCSGENDYIWELCVCVCSAHMSMSVYVPWHDCASGHMDVSKCILYECG